MNGLCTTQPIVAVEADWASLDAAYAHAKAAEERFLHHVLRPVDEAHQAAPTREGFRYVFAIEDVFGRGYVDPRWEAGERLVLAPAPDLSAYRRKLEVCEDCAFLDWHQRRDDFFDALADDLARLRIE